MTQPVLKTILHLGLGSFHRAHQAVYMQRLRSQGDETWQLVGGNLRADMTETIDVLCGQNGQYTLETVTPDGRRSYEWIGSIKKIVPYETGIPKLIQIGADPTTRILSFTVTEAGYYFDTSDQLDFGFADLQNDLDAARSGKPGSTIYGALVAILRARMIADAGPLTLLNCDNLRHNGDRSRDGLMQFIRALDDAPLEAWVSHHTDSPNCMVDRITPRPSAQVVARVKQQTGREDRAAVMAEDFIQWVIEDRFGNERPDWSCVGVEMVEDVAPYEEAKIRILNATHSCIAWAGTLLGYQFIHEGVNDPSVRQWAFDYVTNDVIPCLTPSPLNLADYRDVVLDRFANPAIEDTNQRVAMDGFSKVPGFIAPTIRERLQANASINDVAVLPALFLAFLHRWHNNGLAYEYEDQSMDPTRAHLICDAADPIAAFANECSLWGEMAGDARLEAGLRSAAKKIDALLAIRAD